MIKTIPNTGGRYQASDEGRIFGPSGKELIQRTDKWGYRVVRLQNVEGKRQVLRFVHRLVAMTFIPNDDAAKTLINHKDEDKANNHVSNLEWCTNEYNIRYGTAISRRAKTRTIQIAMLNEDGSVRETFDSAKEAAEATGIARSSIWKAARGDYERAGGYKWRASKPGRKYQKGIPPSNLCDRSPQDPPSTSENTRAGFENPRED